MKVLRIILSLYILFLTTLPCVDMGNDCNHQHQGETGLYPLNSKTAEHNDIDGCSPFCVCNCCQVNVLTQSTMLIPEPIQYYICEIPVYITGKIQEIPLPFWQPPKVTG